MFEKLLNKWVKKFYTNSFRVADPAGFDLDPISEKKKTNPDSTLEKQPGSGFDLIKIKSINIVSNFHF